MFLQLQQQSILLGRRPSGFTEHYYTEWDDGLGKEKISLFLLMSVGSTQVPGVEIGKEAFQLLQDHFLDDLVGDPYDRFENALREVNLMIGQKERDLELKFVPNMHMIAGVVQKDMLFLSQRGEAQGYLLRKRHVSSITDGLYDEKNKEELFQNIASGTLEVGDAVLFVTGPLVQFVTPNDLSKIFSEQALGDAVKELDDLLHSDIEDQMALLALEVLERAEELEPELAGGESEENVAEIEMEESFETGEMGAGKSRLSKLKAHRERIKKSLEVFRSWGAGRDRWEFLNRFRSLGKKQILIGGSILAVVLIGGTLVLGLGMSKQRSLSNMESKLALAEENITQAATRGTFDKMEASDLLDQAQDLVVEVLDSGFLGGDASQLLDEIDAQRLTLDNVQVLKDEIKLIADLSAKLNGTSLLGFERYNDRYVTYTSGQSFEVLLDQVQDGKTLDSTEKVIAARYFAEYDTIVMLTLGGKVLEYTDGNAQFADSSDVAWHSGVDVGTYSNKIYILDSVSNQIWRYGRGSAGYGVAQAYVSGEPELTDAVSLAVDGSVWVLKKDGSLIRFYGGELIDYKVNKAPLTSMAGATRVYTELSLNQIYVLNPTEGSIFVYDKSAKNNDLTYNAQYKFEGLKGNLVDLIVDQDKNTLVLLTDQAMYEWAF